MVQRGVGNLAEAFFDRTLAWPVRIAQQEVHRPRFGNFQRIPNSLNALEPSLQPYRSYIWPFFMEQEAASASVIGQAWSALEAARNLADEDKALDGVLSFKDDFRRFAVRNVDQATETLRGSFVELRLVLSNHAFAAGDVVTGPLRVRPSRGGCAGWSGTIHWSLQSAVPGVVSSDAST